MNVGGFDIDSGNGRAYLMQNNHLYTFNLKDFIVTGLGAIGGSLGALNLLDGLSIQQ